jgi:release factor glutamine methyltransferase
MTVQTLLNVKDALLKSAQWLSGKGVSGARLDAELLLGEVLGMKRLELYLMWDRPLHAREREQYLELLKRRAQFEPIAYILGRREFFSIDFKVGPGVLVPRPETEFLVERVLSAAKALDTPVIADVGTGSGAIAVALAVNLPGARIVATDISEPALAIARENARAQGVEDAIRFVHTAFLDGVDETFDWVVSNPPYIAESDRATLSPDVAHYEPDEALFSGPDGLDAIRVLIPRAAERVRPGGGVALEIGAGQGAAVRDLFESGGHFEAVDVTHDYQGIERVVAARRV